MILMSESIRTGPDELACVFPRLDDHQLHIECQTALTPYNFHKPGAKADIGTKRPSMISN
jgi:hypothetical protein